MSGVDTELFELCKEVYETTGVGNDAEAKFLLEWRVHSRVTREPVSYSQEQYPIYTSDYLLEKLRLSETSTQPQIELIGNSYNWKAYRGYCSPGIADTPLKALLKLTLALHDAGELQPAEDHS